jgi:hypothetical protein
VDQIADLTAHQRTGSLRVFPDHQFVPDAHLVLLLDPHQFQSYDRTHLGWNSLGFGYQLQHPPWTRPAFFYLRCRQLKPTFSLQLPQRLQAATKLMLAARILKSELLADLHGHVRSRRVIFGFQ